MCCEMKPKCLYPGCDNVSHTRGLCKNHYLSIRGIVVSQKATWGQLESAGKCLHPQKGRNCGLKNEWFLEGIESVGCVENMKNEQ